MAVTETIAAIATAPGIGGIGILRISGSSALAIGEALTLSKLEKGRFNFRQFLDAEKNPLDHGLCLYFKGPHSFSGEDCIEVQGHGGPVLLDMLLERVCQLGAVPARAGQFSERAFLNGKIDLTQAEAIADLIESGSRAAARAAMRSLEGRFSEQVHSLVAEVINLRAYIEAALDFAEEEIDFLDDSHIGNRLQDCIEQLQHLLKQAEQGRTLQEGLSVSLAGLPNAGKSSLLNYLAGYDAAIVTEHEGTTRDVLREQISLKGIPLRINDTAGLRDTQNPIEQEGIRRAWEEIGKSDVVLLLVDAGKGISPADEAIMNRLPADTCQLLLSKCDLIEPALRSAQQGHYISTVTGEGMAELIEIITGEVSDYNQDSQVFMARRRHVEALKAARENLHRAAQTFTDTQSGELMAEDLRDAQNNLNEITGEFNSDDLLGKIFSSFCIGK